MSFHRIFYYIKVLHIIVWYALSQIVKNFFETDNILPLPTLDLLYIQAQVEQTYFNNNVRIEFDTLNNFAVHFHNAYISSLPPPSNSEKEFADREKKAIESIVSIAKNIYQKIRDLYTEDTQEQIGNIIRSAVNAIGIIDGVAAVNAAREHAQRNNEMRRTQHNENLKKKRQKKLKQKKQKHKQMQQMHKQK